MSVLELAVTIVYGLFVVSLPVLLPVLVIVGGMVLVAVIIAVVGAVRSAFTHPEASHEVDMADFFAPDQDKTPD